MEGLVTLSELADRLDLPKEWLKREAKAGNIPGLRVGTSKLFSVDAVRDCITNRARRYNLDNLPVYDDGTPQVINIPSPLNGEAIPPPPPQKLKGFFDNV